MRKPLSIFFVYSFWIYVLSILYFFDIISYSPLFSNLLMVTFLPAILIFNKSIPFIHKLVCLITEISFLVLVLIKDVKMDYVFNYLLIMGYLILLAINNKSLCDIYCSEIPYIIKKLSNKFKKRFCVKDVFNYITLF